MVYTRKRNEYAASEAYRCFLLLWRCRQAPQRALHQFCRSHRDGHWEAQVDRFRRDTADEMKSAVLEFILLEIEANRGMERVWGEDVPKLEEGGGRRERPRRPLDMPMTLKRAI